MKIHFSLPSIMPLLIFGILIGLLIKGLDFSPQNINSPLLHKINPGFNLPVLASPNQTLSANILKNNISLINVWSINCYYCKIEHNLLMQLSQSPTIQLIGINSGDEPALALAWLKESGNPYKFTLQDVNGSFALEWGTYGTPESFLVGPDGIILMRKIGILTQVIWENEFVPLIKKVPG